MYHVAFTEQTNTSYEVAILIKTSALSKKSLLSNYVEPIGLDINKFIGFSLEYPTAKPKASDISNYLDKLLPAINSLGIKYLLVNDSLYFKKLANTRKAEHQHGVFYPCAIKGYEHIQVILGVNYQSFIYDPKQADKLALSLNAIKETLSGFYIPLGSNVIHSKKFITSNEELISELKLLLDKPMLTIDIEAFSLNITQAGIGTITFCDSQHTGIVTPIGMSYEKSYLRETLKQFFIAYKGKKVFHRAAYDVSVLIYELFMENEFDYKGMLYGINVMCNNLEDTLLIAYLATNSTARNELSLKVLAQPFLGNYTEENIHDITLIDRDDLLLYNLKDGLGTFYVYNQYYPKMVADNQLDIYETIFKPSLKTILQMQLTGVPLCMDKVKEAEIQLQHDIKTATDTLLSNQYVKDLILKLRQAEFDKMHSEWKTKTEPLSYFDYVTYNPASNTQNQVLLYQVMGLPVLTRTDKKLPSTSNKAIKKLRHQTSDPKILEVLNSLEAIADASIILNNFINAFKTKSVYKSDGNYWLHGSFNLGGTVSGRLSSSDP